MSTRLSNHYINTIYSEGSGTDSDAYTTKATMRISLGKPSTATGSTLTTRAMTLDGLAWGISITLPFEDMKVGILDEMREQHERTKEAKRQAKRLRAQVVFKIQELKLGE